MLWRLMRGMVVGGAGSESSSEMEIGWSRVPGIFGWARRGEGGVEGSAGGAEREPENLRIERGSVLEVGVRFVISGGCDVVGRYGGGDNGRM